MNSCSGNGEASCRLLYTPFTVLRSCSRQIFVDRLVYYYYLLSVVRSDRSTLGDCSPVPRQSRRLRRLVRNLIARRHSAGLCPVLGQLERVGGPAAPSLVVPRLRRTSVASRHEPSLSNRVATCSETLSITRELCQLMTCMHKFYRRCSF